jgi:hypothetical protein
MADTHENSADSTECRVDKYARGGITAKALTNRDAAPIARPPVHTDLRGRLPFITPAKFDSSHD